MDNLEEIDKFLERQNLPRLNQEETENINRPITNNEIETAIKSLLTSTSWLPIYKVVINKITNFSHIV